MFAFLAMTTALVTLVVMPTLAPFKVVELKAILLKGKFVELKVCEKISDYLKENFVEDLTFFEKKNKIKIDIITDNNLIIQE